MSFRQLSKVLRNRLRQRLLTDWKVGPTGFDTGDPFAEWAATYDDDDNPLIKVEQPVMVQLLGDLSGAAVLDVGSGTGRLVRLAMQQGARWVVGLDKCAEMLARAAGFPGPDSLGGRGRAPSILIRGDMTRLPFADASFDCVIAGLAIGYLATLDNFVREAARVLRPGGRLICSDLHPCGHKLGWQRTYRRADGRCGVAPYHVHPISDIHRSVRSAGLELIEVSEPQASACASAPAALIWSARSRR